MTIPEVVRNNLEVSIISLLVGTLISALVTRLHGKTARLRYSTRVDRVGLSADDAIFGEVRVSWLGNAIRNLYMAEMEIENCSIRDFENVDFKVYVPLETFLLTERTSIANTPYIVRWSEGFAARIAVAPGAAPTADQWAIYYHSREYHLPVFNRGQLLQFTYLCTRPNDDVQPEVFVSTQLKGAKLKRQVRTSVHYGVPVQISLARGLVVCAITVVACGFLVHSVWIATGISMGVGLAAQFAGIAEYKAERWIWKLVAG